MKMLNDTRTPETPHLIDRINADKWDSTIWDNFAAAVNDSDDYKAITDLNMLARKWDNYGSTFRHHINLAFLICCGMGFDTLLEDAESNAKDEYLKKLDDESFWQEIKKES